MPLFIFYIIQQNFFHAFLLTTITPIVFVPLKKQFRTIVLFLELVRPFFMHPIGVIGRSGFRIQCQQTIHLLPMVLKNTGIANKNIIKHGFFANADKRELLVMLQKQYVIIANQQV